MSNRGWTWVDDDGPDVDEEEREMRSLVADILMKEWNALETEREQRSWISREDRDAEADNLAEMERENPGFIDEYKNKQAQADAMRMKKEALEEALSKLGVRPMRPYEHWNEDERIIEYLETRYDYEDQDW